MFSNVEDVGAVPVSVAFGSAVAAGLPLASPWSVIARVPVPAVFSRSGMVTLVSV